MESCNPRLVCTICNCAFSRYEHLQRHQVKHGVTRSFKCRECSRTFNRSDVLRRHERIHRSGQNVVDDPQSQNSSSLSRSARSIVACDRCASAKVRCNGEFPCARCKEKGLLCSLDRPHKSIVRDLPPASFSSPTLHLHQDVTSPVKPEQRNQPAEISAGISWPMQAGMLSLHSGHFSSVTKDATGPELPEGALHAEFPGHQALDTQGGSVSPTEQQATVETIGTSALSPDLGLNNPDSGLLWNDSAGQILSIDDPIWYNFPQFVWQLEDDPLVSVDTQDAVAPDDQRTPFCAPGLASDAVLARDGDTPYTNHPFDYTFKQGYPFKIHTLCDFLQDRSSWDRIKYLPRYDNSQNIAIQNVLGSIRDMISAKVHGILYRALDHHQTRNIPQTFPPAETINYFFHAYHVRFAQLYPMLPPIILTQIDEMQDAGKDSGILLASIMALGCLVTPLSKARISSVQLAYHIRASINERTIRDESYLLDTSVITAFVLMTIFSAWSGDRRHSEFAEAYHCIFTAFFTRRGFYRAPSAPITLHTEDGPGLWPTWASRERDIRLSQVWYIVEQEISLFYCIPSTVNFTRFHRPMPSPEELFVAASEKQWKKLVNMWCKDGVPSTQLHPLSLASFYNLFLRHDFLHLDLSVTPLQLRLLLCTIQTQVMQHAISNRFIPEDSQFPEAPGMFLSLNTSRLCQEELGRLLTKWYILYERILHTHHPCQMTLSCFLMYHLIWIELLVCFEDIQMVAGKEGYAHGRAFLPPLQQWVQSEMSLKAVAHAGQVFQILAMRDKQNISLPIWWPAALSRIALVMWCYAVGLYVATGSTAGIEGVMLGKAPLIALNDPNEKLSMYGKVIHAGEGLPCLKDLQGNLVPLYRMGEMLEACLELLEGEEAKYYPLCESISKFLMDIKRCGIPYPTAFNGSR